MGVLSMILTNTDILKEIENKHIIISPFNKDNLGTNSYDVTLSPKLSRYTSKCLDVRKNNKCEILTIPEFGMLLEPNTLYLGQTNETATSNKYVPMYDGRSSMGRLGIFSHITAGFGDIGFGYNPLNSDECYYPTWTLEIVVIHETIIYPNIRIGQVFFLEPKSEPYSLYSGKYSVQKIPTASLSYQDREVPFSSEKHKGI